MRFIFKVLSKLISILYPPYSHMSISFSQEGEDILLRSFFDELPPDHRGFYVDVGAHHPFRFSNTYYFYRKGWRGINIDATPGSMQPFRKFRTRDVNVELGVGGERSKMTFYRFNEPALNTFDKSIAAEKNGKSGYNVIEEATIEVDRLEAILDQYLDPNVKIDFLTIDVEGLDYIVLCSNNWSKYRPAFVLVESPSMDERTQQTESYLESKGYKLVARTQRTMIFKCL